MINGYLDTVLTDFPFNDKWDVTEPALQQIVRDCITFFYRNRELLRPLWNDPFGEYIERETGREFYLTRNGVEDAFLAHEDIFVVEDTVWTALNSSAVGFGPLEMATDDDGNVSVALNGRGWAL